MVGYNEFFPQWIYIIFKMEEYYIPIAKVTKLAVKVLLGLRNKNSNIVLLNGLFVSSTVASESMTY